MSVFELGRPEASPIKDALADPPRIYQAIITRFDIRRDDDKVRVDAAWREVRLRLMERFLGSSVRSQTHAEFEWWILCDLQCPAETLTRIRRIDPRVRIGLVGPEGEPAAAIELADLRIGPGYRLSQAFPADADIVISTRIDSDDAMDRQFMQVQRERTPLFLESNVSRFLVVAGAGYQYNLDKRRAISTEWSRSSIQTMYERTDMVARLVTGLSGNHGQVPELYPGFADFSRMSWLWVIHGHNVSSGMRRGPGANPEALRRTFSVEW